jgi:hypothetical protein
MKLSQVMRQGAALHPQNKNGWLWNEKDGNITTCAIGAAYEGAFGKLPALSEDTGDALIALGTVIEGNLYTEVTHPTGEVYVRTLGDIIITLNDGDGWSRERIANWLKSIGY